MANIENVKRAIAVMESVPAEKFDIEQWVCKAECGTVACFVGHLALSPDIPEIAMDELDIPVYVNPTATVSGGITALSIFLDIDIRLSRKLAGLSNHDLAGETISYFDRYYKKLSSNIVPADVIEKLKTFL